MNNSEAIKQQIREAIEECKHIMLDGNHGYALDELLTELGFKHYQPSSVFSKGPNFNFKKGNIRVDACVGDFQGVFTSIKVYKG